MGRLSTSDAGSTPRTTKVGFSRPGASYWVGELPLLQVGWDTLS